MTPPHAAAMIPILMHHAIDDRPSPVFTAPAVFAAQVAALAENGYRSLSLGALYRGLAAGEALPARSVVFTFDDGYRSVYDCAWPVLRRYGFGATVFLITGYCGRDNRWPGQPAATPLATLMTWAQIERLAADGCEFGAHTHTHRPLSALSAAAVEDELQTSQAVIAAHLGRAPDAFAYPYGDSSPQAKACVQRHFAGAVGTDLGLASAASDRYALPRIDAYYLPPAAVRSLHTAGFRYYLALRQQLRRLRRRRQRDWEGFQ
jgi:peptidoglycan/xylan/chitin deacetylase (PgdA/CDA1 family)